ncbi:minor capsid protein [Streptococcus marmotae]|uniref:minor capsid protein n=1 Tax=Streptococcus marmotae TaxID=1825069 RepID=UPI00082DB36B|nr:minor capsid protein [Streptococcus marmotae]QBX16925.1 minor capsid protein [Streptococcus phage Javan291]
MNNNDFAQVLLDFINSLGLPIRGGHDYLSETEGLVIYPLPGGQVDSEDMAGNREISLPFEIAMKSQDQEVVNATLWQINTALSNFELDLPSQNGSYVFQKLDVNQPFLNDLNEDGFYIYMLDVTAHLEIERKENA